MRRGHDGLRDIQEDLKGEGFCFLPNGLGQTNGPHAISCAQSEDSVKTATYLQQVKARSRFWLNLTEIVVHKESQSSVSRQNVSNLDTCAGCAQW